MAELRSKVSEAQELGLLAATAEPELNRDVMIQSLSEIVQRTDVTLAVTTSTISEAVRELNNLEAEENTVSSALTTLRRRLAEMNRIQTSASNYHEALRIQRDRLQISDWLVEHRTGDENCPVCGGDFQSSDEKLSELHDALVELEKSAGINAELPAAFEREVQRVQDEISTSTEQLKAIQIRKSSLSGRSQEARQRQFQARRVERFIGNLENALELHKRLGEDTELRNEITNLKNREQELLVELRAQNIETRRRRALSIVNSNAERLLPSLDVERPNDPISLETNDLTVRVTGLRRDDYLSEIGSGSNWLSYHVAVLLGLHQYFLTQEHSPIPSFLVMDQPSQVYFPKQTTVRPDETITEPQLRDEDVLAVRKVFRVLSEVVSLATSKLQIIVLDHAASDVWGGIDNVVEVEEWREGKKLVPEEWL